LEFVFFGRPVLNRLVIPSALTPFASSLSCLHHLIAYVVGRSKAPTHKPKVAAQTIALIRQMATQNRLWGAERIRGELLKLGVHVCKRTVQKYMRNVRRNQPRGQKWSTFLHTHAKEIWACDFLEITDLFFRPLFAFFLIELQSRKVIHVGVTRSPTDAWVAQQLREATPYGHAPKY
jgi:putative transposase